MANVRWTMKLYDLDGDELTANDMNSPVTSSNEIKHATNRTLHFYLNGVDQLDFTLFLDDPMADMIFRLYCVVKVYREVFDDDGDLIYFDDTDTPAFAGLCAATVKDGDSNTMTVTCYSPLWRLQSRFHILNHYLNINTDTSSQYKQSELLWKIIELVNGAFGGSSFTGIAEGTFFDVATEIEMAPYFIGKGTNSWSHFETVLDRAGSVDILPVYYHVDSNPTYMFFNTQQKRGSEKLLTVNLTYNIDVNSNLSNLVEEETAISNEFANYVWAVGQGGPNSGKIALDENINDDIDGYDNIGIYMRRADFPDVKTIAGLSTIVTAELSQSRVPKKSYTATISPSSSIAYGSDFEVGDLVALNASKGALSVTGAARRVYDSILDISDNNIETVTVLLAPDFYGKIPT